MRHYGGSSSNINTRSRRRSYEAHTRTARKREPAVHQELGGHVGDGAKHIGADLSIAHVCKAKVADLGREHPLVVGRELEHDIPT